MAGTSAATTCAVCGNITSITAISPLPDPQEPPDFDTRPGEPLRSTILQWLQSCEQCGYAAEDISAADPAAAPVVQSESYQQIRFCDTVPAQARRFLCYAHLLERLRQFADSGWSCLHAAWVCDDCGDDPAALDCRIRALSMWQRGKAAGQAFGDDMASEFALVTDVYRRTAQHEQAITTCGAGLDLDDIPPSVDAVLRRQMVLIQSRDTAAHSMKELLKTA